MPDSTSSLMGVITDVLTYLFVALMGAIAWVAKRLHLKVDKISSEYVSTETYNETIKSLRSHIDDGFKGVRDDIRGVHTRIDNFMDKK